MTTPDQRRNLAERSAELFKPPIFQPNTSARNRTINAIRRFADLQVGSAWRDLGAELAQVSGTVLDIGCGAQVFRSLLPAGAAYRGIDTSDAKERFGYDVPDTTYFDGDDWQVPDRSVDVALCTEVLEHIEAPLPFLRQVVRTLRPGGTLLLTVPFAARWHFIPYDYWRYTPSTLRKLLHEAGFADVRVTARGNPLTVACYKVMALTLILLFDGEGSGAGLLAKRVVGLLTLPLFAAAAVIGNASMGADWGDDCLGYTVSARRPATRALSDQAESLGPM